MFTSIPIYSLFDSWADWRWRRVDWYWSDLWIDSWIDYGWRYFVPGNRKWEYINSIQSKFEEITSPETTSGIELRVFIRRYLRWYNLTDYEVNYVLDEVLWSAKRSFLSANQLSYDLISSKAYAVIIKLTLENFKREFDTFFNSQSFQGSFIKLFISSNRRIHESMKPPYYLFIFSETGAGKTKLCRSLVSRFLKHDTFSIDVQHLVKINGYTDTSSMIASSLGVIPRDIYYQLGFSMSHSTPPQPPLLRGELLENMCQTQTRLVYQDGLDITITPENTFPKSGCPQLRLADEGFLTTFISMADQHFDNAAQAGEFSLSTRDSEPHRSASSPEDALDAAVIEILRKDNPHTYSTISFIQKSLMQFNLACQFEAHEILNEAYVRGREFIRSGGIIRNAYSWLKSTSLNIIREISRKQRRDYIWEVSRATLEVVTNHVTYGCIYRWSFSWNSGGAVSSRLEAWTRGLTGYLMACPVRPSYRTNLFSTLTRRILLHNQNIIEYQNLLFGSAVSALCLENIPAIFFSMRVINAALVNIVNYSSYVHHDKQLTLLPH